MSVVIEEMEGTVEPETTEPSPRDKAQSKSTTNGGMNLFRLRAEMKRMAERELRLRAD